MVMLKVELLRIYNRIYYKRKNNSYVNSGMISKTASIGENCHLSKNVFISENVKIGNFTYFNSGVFGNIVVEEDTEIGSYCSIAPNVFIGPGNHPLNYLTTHPLTYNRYWMSKIGINYTNFSERERNTEVSNVIIKNDVWIGMNSIIMKGVTIGNGAVIAAGSVVTKNIPAYTIVGGVPAREIGKRFPEKTITMLENKNEKWWDWSPEKISNEFNKFYDIQLYLDS